MPSSNLDRLMSASFPTGRPNKRIPPTSKYPCCNMYVLTTEALDTTRFEIVATSVTFQQENLTSPIKLSFSTIQRVSIEKGIYLSNSFSSNQMVLWHDYLIGSFARRQPGTWGLFLWNMRENSIFYFEVCHTCFPSPGALNPNSRQMAFVPRFTKVCDDILFIIRDIFDVTHRTTAYRCIHLPSLVISTQLPGGSLSLTENAFAVLLPKCIMESRAKGSPFLVHTKIYSIPGCPPTYPRYCFTIQRLPRQSQTVDWEVIEVEIDLSIPGPIKVFSRVSQQYTVQHPAFPLHDSDEDLLLYLPLGRGGLPPASLSVRFLRVGKLGKKRQARLGGLDKLRLSGLGVDRDAGYVIIWAAEGPPQWYRQCSFIWWLDERNPGNTGHSRTREWISSWSRGLLRRL